MEEADHVVDAKELREEVEHVAKELPRVGVGVRVRVGVRVGVRVRVRVGVTFLP